MFCHYFNQPLPTTATIHFCLERGSILPCFASLTFSLATARLLVLAGVTGITGVAGVAGFLALADLAIVYLLFLGTYKQT
jgi:hypothetical protein